MNRTQIALALLLAAPAAACGGEQAPEPPAEAPAGAAGGMQGMEGMEGMEGMRMGGDMMQEMRAYMGALEGQSGEQLRTDLARHRQLVANLLAQMNREMRQMDMPGDQEWNALVEALRDDLRRMPEMSAAELEALMPEHRARVVRLMDMHHDMMGNMRM